MNCALDAFNITVDMFNKYANKPNDIGEFFRHTLACEKVKKALKALEIIKENLVVGYDENSNDKPCLVIGAKVSKDNLVIVYETFEQDKVNLLKEALQ